MKLKENSNLHHKHIVTKDKFNFLYLFIMTWDLMQACSQILTSPSKSSDHFPITIILIFSQSIRRGERNLQKPSIWHYTSTSSPKKHNATLPLLFHIQKHKKKNIQTLVEAATFGGWSNPHGGKWEN